MDFSILLLIIEALLFFLPFPYWLKVGGLSFLFTFIALLILLLRNMKDCTSWFDSAIFGKLGKPIAEKLKNMLGYFMEGIQVFSFSWNVTIAFLYVLLEWVFHIIFLKLVLLAFQMSLPLSAYIFIIAASNLSFAIPSSPGSIGIFEFLNKTGLVYLFSMEANLTMSFILVYHFLLIFPVSLVGIFCFWKESLPIKEMDLNPRV